jgi:hypothetical protein
MGVRGTLTTEAHQFLMRKAQLFAQGAQVLLNKIGVEPVVASCNGSVGGKDHFPGDQIRGRIKVHAFFLHAIANCLEDRKTTVPLVEMKNSRRNAHGLKSAKAANAEEQLLTNARASVPAIQTRGQFQVLGCIARYFGVEQQKVTTPHLHPPDLGTERTAASFNVHNDRFPVLANGQLHRQLVDVGLEVFLPLPSALIKALQEVALSIKQADPDERDTEVGCTLDVVPGEDAQASGINWQGFVQSELSRKIGYRARPEHACVGCSPRAVCA